MRTKIFAKHISIRIDTKICADISRLNNMKITQLKNGQKLQIDTEEDTQMANKHMTRGLTSYVIRVFEIERAVRQHYILITMTKIQNTENTKDWRGCGATGILISQLAKMQNGTAT